MVFRELPAAALATVLLCAPAAAQSQAATPTAPAPAAAQTVRIDRYEVQGNTLLHAEEVDATLKPFTGQVTMARLREAVAALQDAYRQLGYGAVVAFLPEQALDAGVARIRVVEGKVVKVDVEGQQAFSLANVRASLPALQEGRTPEVRLIDAQIQMANENPAKGVQVLLQPGTQPGEVLARVKVAESPVLRVTGRLDNTGGESLGRWRAAIGLQHANLFDRDHVAALELQTAPENASAVTVLSGSYRVPLYAQAMAVDVYGALSNVDAGTVGSAAGDLSFSGKGSILGSRLSWYLARIHNIDQRLLLGLELREYDNECSIAGQAQGACGSAGASVSVQPASLTYTAQASGDWRWGASLGLHTNLAAGGRHGSQADFEAVRPDSRRRYALLRGSGQVALPLGDWAQLALRAAWQLSDQPLIPGELFGIGGASSVRGFEERELAGDRGISIGWELASPNQAERIGTWFGLPSGADVRLLAFGDAGFVSNLGGATCLAGRNDCRMGSLGLGLRGALGGWQLRLDIARAFTTATTTARGDVRAHAALLYNF